MRSALYEGTLVHVRSSPARNDFRYRVHMWALDLDELDALDRRLVLFSYNRPNVLCLRDGDHLGDPGRPVKENLLAWLGRRGVDLGTGARVALLTNLRTFGYVFNPVSYFWCRRADGELAAIVAEVTNTFGERHAYLLDAGNRIEDGARSVYEHPKQMHVSPFLGLDQTYRFSFTEPGERVRVGVGVVENGRRPLWAEFAGERRALTNARLARVLARRPLMSQQVIGLIHWQAVKLAMKKVPLHHKPPFRPGEGSLPPTPPGASGPSTPRRALRPPPRVRRSPLAPLARRAALRALTRPARGRLTVRLPDGTTRHGGDPTTGPDAALTVASRDLWRRLATRGRLAVGEAYTAGDWSSDDLVGLLESLALTAEAARHGLPGRLVTEFHRRRPKLPAGHDLIGSRRDVEYHYDLGNDLYALFLDEGWSYSCAVWETPDATLEEAQEAKYARICAKLALDEGSRVLEIGCGWGGFAIHAAREHGARVTGLTLSQEQATLARERIADAGLSDRVEIRLEDYRRHAGRYSHLASIEMLEAIGHRELPVFFAAVDRLLERDGIACVQTIAVPDQRYGRYRRSNDWIREYVFPGATIPSLEAISRAMTRSSELIVHDVENIGYGYAETLRRWRERFLANREAVLALGYDERFVRAWEFYLGFCEAGFRTRALHDYQLVLSRPFNGRLPTAPRSR